MTREELLAKMEAATGPDRGLDTDIHEALTGNCVHRVTHDEYVWDGIEVCDHCRAEQPRRDWPAYTASIDAALGLVERLLPHHLWQVKRGIEVQAIIWALETDYDDRPVPTGYHASSPPLAILAALLRALHPSNEAER